MQSWSRSVQPNFGVCYEACIALRLRAHSHGCLEVLPWQLRDQLRNAPLGMLSRVTLAAFCQHMSRLAQLCANMAGSLCGNHLRPRDTAALCRDLLTNLGPCFIKAGQVLANRPDIIRQDYMDELCVLQDDVPSFPDAVAFDIIEENLARPLQDVLSYISERPIAAASLGQVPPPLAATRTP
jgi:predicted unusual protein kinase regulating ubiquinone biosynthesis (AarF/ABC1/UbiB family)